VLNHNPTAFRGVPDLSFDSNPYTGAWVWDSFGFQISSGQSGAGWLPIGGTSLASAALPGIINAAGSFVSSSASENALLISNRFVATEIRDITAGYCGPYSGWTPLGGWDFCTGVGSPLGYLGK
jgi:hypothetical protein